MGGETGPDLTKSALVRDDASGDRIAAVIRDGRTDKGMPAFHLAAPETTAVISFIRSQKEKAESKAAGARRSVDLADLQTGSADAGRQYFNGAGRCATCHSPAGDFAGIAGRLKGLELLQRMLYPSRGGGRHRRRDAAVGREAQGGARLSRRVHDRAHRRCRPLSIVAARSVTFTVDNPLDAHVEQLGEVHR